MKYSLAVSWTPALRMRAEIGRTDPELTRVLTSVAKERILDWEVRSIGRSTYLCPSGALVRAALRSVALAGSRTAYIAEWVSA